MTNVDIIIGANYGDEGKGLATDYFAEKAARKGKQVLVVCSNGGAQRGHTVDLGDGRRHVFHHFGSGSYAGADTFLDYHFICNPMVFRKEYEELVADGLNPTVYIHADCFFSTPYDMIINQIVEELRGKKKHGSCGMGIWETLQRVEKYPDEYTRVGDFQKLSKDIQTDFLRGLRDTYVKEKLESYGISSVSPEWKKVLESDVLIENFLDDFQFMMAHCIKVWRYNKLPKYDTIVFEMGQGLMLDERFAGEGNVHTTPSITGVFIPRTIIDDAFTKEYMPKEVEVVYVTRTYLTRHGAGKLPGQCNKRAINLSMLDRTNVPNPHQGTLRYAKFSSQSFDDYLNRCSDDFYFKHYFNVEFDDDYSMSFAITHTNECELCVDISDIVAYDEYTDNVYLSDGETCESVTVGKVY